MQPPIQHPARSNVSIRTAPVDARESLSPEEPLARQKTTDNRARSASIISRLKGEKSPTLLPANLPQPPTNRRSRRLSASSAKVKELAASIAHRVRHESDDSESEHSDVYDDDLEVTGFAVASNRRNADFHALFPRVDEGDYLIEGKQGIARKMLIKTTAVPCPKTFSFKGACTCRKTTFAFMPTSLAGLRM